MAENVNSWPGRKPQISLTRTLPCPNIYVRKMDEEFAAWAFNEERAPQYRGQWRSQVFNVSETQALDLEIGTGNGFHFAHYAQTYPQRCLIGIEIKYKPLIQSIRRALRNGSQNARIMRYDACFPHNLFAENELNHVFIHFPDPWEKKRHWKNRLVNTEFLNILFDLQREGSFVDFKTDSADYFEWALPQIQKSRYKIIRQSTDLHNSEWNNENFVTQFESLFIRQGLKINYVRLAK